MQYFVSISLVQLSGLGGRKIASVSKYVFHCHPHCLRICAQYVLDNGGQSGERVKDLQFAGKGGREEMPGDEGCPEIRFQLPFLLLAFSLCDFFLSFFLISKLIGEQSIGISFSRSIF